MEVSFFLSFSLDFLHHLLSCTKIFTFINFFIFFLLISRICILFQLLSINLLSICILHSEILSSVLSNHCFLESPKSSEYYVYMVRKMTLLTNQLPAIFKLANILIVPMGYILYVPRRKNIMKH